MSKTLLELRDVTRHFEISQGAFHRSATLTAVANVSLQVKRGEVYALVGESGSGKSTLAKMLLGLLPPSSGEILIDGVPLADSDRVAIARRIQPIFQDPYSSLNPRKSIAQLIALPLMVHGVGDSASRRAKVTEMLDMVGPVTASVRCLSEPALGRPAPARGYRARSGDAPRGGDL